MNNDGVSRAKSKLQERGNEEAKLSDEEVALRLRNFYRHHTLNDEDVSREK